MNVIFILIAVSLLVAIGFLVAFIWTIRTGQFEDEYTPSVRVLFDDEKNIIEEIPNSIRQLADQKPNKSQIRNQKKETKQKQKRTKQKNNQLTKNQ